MSPEDFLKELDEHDWHYSSHEDFALYKKGRAEAVRIYNTMSSSDTLKQVYVDYLQYRAGERNKPTAEDYE